METWDLFEIFAAHEDNYTNMLHFLFEKDNSFRTQFLKQIFKKEVEDAKEIVFNTRNVYRRENSGKSIPDIIIFNRNYFAIIEVKVFSGEGDKQTQRYFDDHKSIMENLNVDPCCTNKRFLYLTIDGKKPECEAFEKLCWSDVAECMNPDACSNEMAKLLMSQFKTRIISIKQSDIALDGVWEEQVHSYLWSGAIRFYSALKHLFDELNIDNIEWEGMHWAGFNKSSNSYELSAKFYPKDKSWQGLKLEDAMKCNLENGCVNTSRCYDYHFEFKWDEAKKLLTMRLDYELNPYMSEKYISKIDDERLKQFAIDCNRKRAEKARANKEKWKYIAPDRFKDSYNAHIKDCLIFLVKTEYNKDELVSLTVTEVLDKIRPFIDIGTKFINKYFLSARINA